MEPRERVRWRNRRACAGADRAGAGAVRRFAELGVVLDLAHASEQTWRNVVDEDVRFSVTHAGCRAVCDHPRNLADWQLEALADRGGVLGMMALAFVVDPQAPAISRWLDHVEHAVAVMGIEHVGLGADFVDQVAPTVEGHGVDAGPHAETVADRKSRLGLDGFTGPKTIRRSWPPSESAAMTGNGSRRS